MVYLTAISAIAGVGAVFVALLLYLLTKYNFLLSNRPYLIMVKCLVQKPAGIMPEPTRMIYKCFRTPVKVRSGEFWFGIFEDGVLVEKIDRHIPLEQEIIPPMGGQEGLAWVEVPHKLYDELLGKYRDLRENQELRMQVYFKYEWAGDNKFNKVYSYKGIWKLAKEARVYNGEPLEIYDWNGIEQQIT